MKEYFERIKDLRQQSKGQHNFTETIMMIICVVIAGCDVWEDIADYCRVKEAWFKERLGLKVKNGIPSHDTMSRIFGMIEPKEFQTRFIEWVEGTVNREAWEILSIDGKTMRGSRDKEKRPIHMVSAWASKAKAVFGQIVTEEKTNEITAVPLLLELLDTNLTDIDEFSQAVRSHWGVENSLYWCLDITFREDHSRMRADHIAESFASSDILFLVF